MQQYHSLHSGEAIKQFASDKDKGLTDSAVMQNRAKYGENQIAAGKQKSNIILFLEQFHNPVIYILIVAAVLNSLVAEIKDALVIGAVVILNTVIGFVQERRAADALKALRKLSAPIARVIRNGEQVQIPTSEVVCGDILVLESGMRSPADARLIDTLNFLVDESMLTGESFAIEKNANAQIPNEAPLGDRVNMVYSGTIIQKGRALAVVTSVGAATEFGKISQNIIDADDTVSPLQINIAKFGKGLSFAIMIIIAVIFLVGFLRGQPWITMLMTSVGLAVSAIPEGLPVAITITFSVGIYQMAKHKAIVKKLAAVETLGSANIICTDKTGTLTKNQMTATHLFVGGEKFDVTGSGYNRIGEVIKKDGSKIKFDSNPAFEIFSLAAQTCTESTISDNNGEWVITGDPTEGALMIAADKLGLTSNNSQISVDIPFESENQLMAVRVKNHKGNFIFAKGAPERIIARCNDMIDLKGNPIPLESKHLSEQVKALSDNGLRVLAVAYAPDTANTDLNLDTLNGLSFLGFAGIEDAVREEAIHAVTDCRNAGIKVVMITGDHVQTARAVARSVGIAADKPSPVAIGGPELDKMTEEQLFDRVPDIDVYARVAPQHKYSIVKQLQKHGNVVAMTGDGVNDAPALKQADIGVAMGSGTDVAKEASHIVLLDDNFATIVKAVRRGRIILQNLQHILLYILSTSAGGLLTIAMSVAAGFPLPVLPAQLLWINLVTDGTSTFPLAFEKEHGNVMAYPPRRKTEPLIPVDLIWRIAISGFIMMLGTLGVFIISAHDVYNPTPAELAYAQTMAFCTLAFFQIWNVQNSRSLGRSLLFNLPATSMNGGIKKSENKLDRIGLLKNPILLGVMLLAILLQVSAVALPFMNTLLNTVPLGLKDWLTVIAVSFSIIIFVELLKFGSAVVNKKRGIVSKGY